MTGLQVGWRALLGLGGHGTNFRHNGEWGATMTLNRANLVRFGTFATVVIMLILHSLQFGRTRPVRASNYALHNSSLRASVPSQTTITSIESAGSGAQPVQSGRSLPPTAKATAQGFFEFSVVTLSSDGQVVTEGRGQAQYYTEDLGTAVKLEMVQIPGGSFMMGTSYAEAAQVAAEYHRYAGDDANLTHYADESVAMEIPQHSVTLRSFFMGKFEVTQAQWRAVATLPRITNPLATDPSFFKGDDLPVEEVTWEDAIEFCARLSRATGREYRLPSESEWEYACRAGTGTQFHFGDTITTELVNYNGRYPYGSAPPGINRRKTVRVGSLGVLNAFGLSDMHGNVEEWCMDSWHENYNGAPSDGRVWITNGGSPWVGCGMDYRVVRGGAWLGGPCRSADRNRRWWANNKNYFTGFRIVCTAGNS